MSANIIKDEKLQGNNLSSSIDNLDQKKKEKKKETKAKEKVKHYMVKNANQ